VVAPDAVEVAEEKASFQQGLVHGMRLADRFDSAAGAAGAEGLSSVAEEH
jgi:hypothetical protein